MEWGSQIGDRHFYHSRAVCPEGRAQRVAQPFVVVQPYPQGSVDLREFGEVRVVQPGPDDPAAEPALLVVVGRAQHFVVEDQCDHVDPFLNGGAQLSRRITEPSVTRGRHNLLVRVAHLGAQGGREGIAKRREVGRGQVGAGLQDGVGKMAPVAYVGGAGHHDRVVLQFPPD